MAVSSAGVVFDRRGFKNRVYAVTGAAQGIGLATARALARLGAGVAIIDADAPSLRAAHKELAAGGAQVLSICGDVGSQRLFPQAVRKIERRFGRLDGWVSNVGINLGDTLEKMSERAFHRQWQVNTLAAWRAARAALPLLKKSDRASLVHISSILSHEAPVRNIGYTTTKSALEGLTRSMATDLGPQGIRVNAILPGAIHTHRRHWQKIINQYPAAMRQEVLATWEKWTDLSNAFLQAMPVAGQPDDIAQPVLFLLSDASRFVTGTCLVVDAGRSVASPKLFSEEFHEMGKLSQRMLELRKEFRKWYRSAVRKGQIPARKRF